MFTPQSQNSWGADNAQIVRMISTDDPRGLELLYRTYGRGLKFLAARHSREHAEDVMHDAVLSAVQQIKEGKLIAPAALPGYLAVIVKRLSWNRNTASERRSGDQETFDSVLTMQSDERYHPGRLLEIKEQARLMQNGLRQLKAKEQEILTRFYLNEEKREEICMAMNLTETQFRLMKCRGKQVLQREVAKSMRKPASVGRGNVSAYAMTGNECDPHTARCKNASSSQPTEKHQNAQRQSATS